MPKLVFSAIASHTTSAFFGESVLDQKGARPIRPLQLEPLVAAQISVRQTQVVQHGRQVEKLAVVLQAVALADCVGKQEAPRAMVEEERRRQLRRERCGALTQLAGRCADRKGDGELRTRHGGTPFTSQEAGTG